jgi:hypothetical protein
LGHLDLVSREQRFFGPDSREFTLALPGLKIRQSTPGTEQGMVNDLA